jgi:hypothetical protein
MPLRERRTLPAIGFPTSTPARHLSGWIWWTVLATVTIGLIVGGGKRSVVHNYIAGGEAWASGAPLYDDSGAGFIYLPHMAILFAPLSQMSTAAGESIWRLFALSLFASGVYRLCRIAERELSVELFLTTTLLTLPLSWSAAQNGQATLPMAGLMLHAVADVHRQAWNRCSFWLWLAVGIKPLAVVLLLLIAATKPKTWRPLTIGAVCFAGLPFLCQRTAYVWEQLRAVPQMLSTAGSGGQSEYWAQLFGMLEVAGIAVAPQWQTALRIAAALATLGVVALANRRLSTGLAALALYGFAAGYIMLFSPRTENNTYAMLAPAIGIFLAIEADHRHRKIAATGLLLVALGTVGSFEFGRLFTNREQSIWLAPLMALCFVAYLARQCCSTVRLQQVPHQTAPQTAQQSSPSDRKAA